VARYAPAVLERDTIEAALDALDSELAARAVRAELFLVGAVMCLVHRARPSTLDVDGWFTEAATVRDAARRVAEALDLPEDWLNDAAKGFVPAGAGFETWRTLSHLTVATADDRTLFAMKCAAARTDQDADDIRFLATRLGVTSSSAALEVVTAYFPADRLPIRARLLLEEMLDDHGA
jgi:hypothetical protein